MMIYTDKNIKILRMAGVLLFATTLLGGCVKDELHNTPHPDRGAVRVTTDWGGLSQDVTPPESYLLRMGETAQSVSAAENTFEELLPEGSYSLLVHNVPRGITVGAQTATVNTLPNGTLEPLPETLFSAIQQLTVQKDDTLKVSVKMLQAGRRLTLVLKLKAEDVDRIASSSATLTGIAHTVDLATSNPTAEQAGVTVAPAFIKTTVTPVRVAEINALVATLRLLGIVAGERQLLQIVITLTNGSTSTVESDLTEALKNFGSSRLPITLDAEISLPTEGSFGGTITGWTEVENGDITIH